MNLSRSAGEKGHVPLEVVGNVLPGLVYELPRLALLVVHNPEGSCLCAVLNRKGSLCPATWRIFLEPSVPFTPGSTLIKRNTPHHNRAQPRIREAPRVP